MAERRLSAIADRLEKAVAQLERSGTLFVVEGGAENGRNMYVNSN